MMTPRMKQMIAPTEDGENLRKVMGKEINIILREPNYEKRCKMLGKCYRKWYVGEGE